MIHGKRMILTHERLLEVLSYDADTGIFTWVVNRSGTARAGSVAGVFDKQTRYTRISIDGRMYLAHRLAWLFVTGSWPPSELDHINLNRSDNRICNLRLASRAQNRANSPVNKSSQSKIKGVFASRLGARWRARISISSKTLHLGTFPTKEEASAAYLAAARAHYGEFAKG